MSVDSITNSFKIAGGETIKLGRVKFLVKEICTSDDENKTDFGSARMEEQPLGQAFQEEEKVEERKEVVF